MLDVLQSVLDKAQRRHEYRRDIDQFGLPEYWQEGLEGDCEDFALWCRSELKRRGIESDLVLCYVETGGGHLVCSVDGWILDNRHGFVMRRDDLPYHWVSIGAPDGTWRLVVG